jgi:hypothetical protein
MEDVDAFEPTPDSIRSVRVTVLRVTTERTHEGPSDKEHRFKARTAHRMCVRKMVLVRHLAWTRRRRIGNDVRVHAYIIAVTVTLAPDDCSFKRLTGGDSTSTVDHHVYRYMYARTRSWTK